MIPTTPFINFLGQLQDQAVVLRAQWSPVRAEERPIAVAGQAKGT